MEYRSKAKELTAYSFLVALANDAVIDERELAMLKHLALDDRVIDDDERKILRNIFARVPEDRLTDEQKQEIEGFRKEFGV